MYSILRERFETILDEVASELSLSRAPRARRVSRKYAPLAVVCDETAMSLDTVTGVAIVGCTMHRRAVDQEEEVKAVRDSLAMLELVSPSANRQPVHGVQPAAPLSEVPSEATVSPSASELRSPVTPMGNLNTSFPKSQIRSTTADRKSEQRESFWRRVLGCPLGTAAVTTGSGQEPACEDLDEGYIVFTDAFVAHIEDTPLAATLRDFRSPATTPEPPFHIKPSRSQWRQQNMEVRHYMALSEAEYRPLFRRRPSELIYGHSSYDVSPAQ